jgi:hypothetical protein
MKNTIVSILMMLVILFTTSCADSLKVDGKTYEPYGVFNSNDLKDPNVVYKAHIPNMIGAFIFSGSVIFPVYVIAFELFEPVRLKDDTQTTSAE